MQDKAENVLPGPSRPDQPSAFGLHFESDGRAPFLPPAYNTPTKIRSILIILTKPFGDHVIASALIRNLRTHYPGVRIVMFSVATHADFLLSHGIADEVIAFDEKRLRQTFLRSRLPARARELFRILRKIRRQRFDMTIDLTDRKTSRFYVGLINAPVRVGHDPPERPLRKWERQPNNRYVKPFGFGGQHYLHRYLAPLEALDLQLVHPYPVIDPLQHEVEEARELLQQHGVEPGKFIVVHVGAGWIGRCWQPDRFARAMNQVANDTKLPFVLIGGREEGSIGDAVTAETSCRTINLIGKLTLGTLLAVLKDARIFFGNDSGPMHLAAAAGTPVVSLHGMTEPARWGPVGVPHVALRPSMPCQCIDRNLCRFPDTTKSCCVWRLGVDEVVEGIRDLLARTNQ